MLENSLFDNLIVQSTMVQSIIKKNVTPEIINSYISPLGYKSFEEQIDELFKIFFNNLFAEQSINNVDYLRSIFLMVPAYKEQSDDSELNKEMAQAYAEFLVFANTILDSESMLIAEKLEKLLNINYKIMPKSEAKKTYLYYLLNILLALPVNENIGLIQEVTEELKSILE